MGAIFVALTFIGYLGAAVLSVAQLYDIRQARWATMAGWIGFVFQSLWLIQRAVALQAFPVLTLHDWVAFFLWLAVSLFLTAGRILRIVQVGAFLFPIVFVLWLVSQMLPRHLADLPAALNSAWLIVHIALATMGYVAFLLSAVFGIMYLEKERELKNKRVRLFYYQLPSLGEMDAWSARLIAVGLPLLTGSLVVGALLAKSVWGVYWSGTPKDVWSVVIWAVYGFYLVVRYGIGWRGHRVAMYSMTAFLLVVFNFLGVNLLFEGPHHYHF